MTKRLPSRASTDDLVQPGAAELDRAVDADAPVRLVPTDATVIRGGHGLGFALRVNLEPTTSVFRALARAIQRSENARLLAEHVQRSAGCRR